MTDLDVIRHIKEQAEKDAAFMGRNDKEYKAYIKGQVTGVQRAMAFLRECGILKPELIKDVRYYSFR